jgi:hypothetical protein
VGPSRPAASFTPDVAQLCLPRRDRPPLNFQRPPPARPPEAFNLGAARRLMRQIERARDGHRGGIAGDQPEPVSDTWLEPFPVAL